MKKTITFLLLTLFTTVLSAQVTIQGNPYGGNPYGSITAAITAATDGDVILISGIFTEPISIANKSITLRGTNPTTDIIQAAASAASTGLGSRVITLSGTPPTATNITIENLGIRYGNFNANGGGINVDKIAGLVTLKNLIITNNYTSANGGAIGIAGSNAEIINCTIQNNTAITDGGGIIIAANNAAGLNNVVNIKQSLINANNGRNGGGIYAFGNNGFGNNWKMDINIINSTVSNNNATSASGGNGGGAIFSAGAVLTGSSPATSNITLSLIHATFYNNFHLGLAKAGFQFGTLVPTNFSAYNSIIVAADDLNTKAFNFANTNVTDIVNCIFGGYNGTLPTQISDGAKNNLSGKTATQAGLTGTLSSEGGNTQVLQITSASTAYNYCTATTGVSIPTIDQRGTTRTGTYDAGAYELTRTTWTGGNLQQWNNALNWSRGVPDSSLDVTIGTGATQPQIYANVNIKSLTINSGATLEVNADFSLTVTGAITNNGTLTIKNNASLIQVDNVTNTGVGSSTVIRNSNDLLRLDYTLWSSPVASQNLLDFSPATVSTRFYTYDTASNLYNAIASPGSINFTAGKGYLIRMPDNHPITPTVWTGTFTGIPNNGTIPVPITIGYNLVGNPYPSNISFSSLQTDNSGLIGTTAYFWRKTNGAGGSAYCTYNTSGSTYISNGSSGAAPAGMFDGIIQSGQGFFVAATAAGDLNFTNTQRTSTTTNQAFFKTKQIATADKVWLNATSATGDFSQMAVTYSAGATTGVDDFDSKYINDSGYALTSNIDGGEYTIQGRPVFDATDVVALNFKTIAATDYTIALAHTEGVFLNGQDIYLVDSKTGTETNLKADAYTFTATAGVDNARFSLKYQKTLKVDHPTFNDNSVTVYSKNGTLYINSEAIAIQNISVFDIQGRLITHQNNVKANTASISNLKVNQVLIVQVTSEDNTVVNKKVVN
jgi:hypothetical protein